MNSVLNSLGQRLSPEVPPDTPLPSLRDYVRQAWHVTEPATPYADSWHIDAICEHLEAVSRGEIQNLLINMPPRHMKSLTVSVFWPTWLWTRKPWFRWLFSSYAMTLSVRDSLKCRRLIESPWYQSRWGHVYQLTGDQNAKLRFENSRTGYRLATSVDSANTGEGGDCIVCDDPHNVLEAHSDAKRETALTWWSETMSSRLNDPRTGAKVIVMQRVHEKDLSAAVLDSGDYEHLCLPAEYDGVQRSTILGNYDRRSTEGDLLCPERFPRENLDKLKRELGPYAASAQLQQKPLPARGFRHFRREWLADHFVDDVPRTLRRVRYWDLAATKPRAGRDPDYTVGALLGEANGVYWLLDIQRLRSTPQEVESLVRATAELDGRSVPVFMEQEPGSSGVNTIDNYQRRILKGFAFWGVKTTGSKPERALPVSSAMQAGNYRIKRAPWNADFLDEAEAFPGGAHDDQVDAISGAHEQLAANHGEFGVQVI